jgi:hypothetical protein
MKRASILLALSLALVACGESRRHPGKGKSQNASTPGKSDDLREQIGEDEDDAHHPQSNDQSDTDKPAKTGDQDQAHTPDEAPAPRERCTLPGESPELATIKDVVEVINALPMPVTMACFLDVLPRPLRLVATSSGLSIQPALDERNPRIFALSGQLILAVVPDGMNSTLLEFSQILDSQRSIKAEIVFPVTAPLDPEYPYKHTDKLDGSEGTRCAFCHGSETLRTDGYYESRALRPVTSSILPFTQLLDLKDRCKNVVSGRCEIFDALFGEEPGDAMEGKFPADMPTMF